MGVARTWVCRRSPGGVVESELAGGEKEEKERKRKERREEREKREIRKRKEKRGKKFGCSDFRKSKPEFIAFRFFGRNFFFDRLRGNFNFKKNCFENCLPKSRIY